MIRPSTNIFNKNKNENNNNDDDDDDDFPSCLSHAYITTRSVTVRVIRMLYDTTRTSLNSSITNKYGDHGLQRSCFQ